ncbi:MAG TPA: putative toxin-antitoxin system toxin component, PIN family [Thermoanaerobaculia bacterium]|nr:putative toxin-antitoxin system toxin component, PIN family [Thermoanaerobaculia bacterium]
MNRRIVVDTNLWIRALLGGPVTLPLLKAWRAGKFEVLISQSLLEELEAVSQRPRLKERIDPAQSKALLEQLRWRAQWVEATAIPPRCRDPKDHPVLATAISGHADAIVSGDGDLRADGELRQQMLEHGVKIWGITGLLADLEEEPAVG